MQLQRGVGEEHKATGREEEKEKVKKGGADMDKIEMQKW